MNADRKRTSVSSPSRRIAASTWVPSRPGHADVEHRHLRLQVADPLERLAAVAGLGDQLEVRAGP